MACTSRLCVSYAGLLSRRLHIPGLGDIDTSINWLLHLQMSDCR